MRRSFWPGQIAQGGSSVMSNDGEAVASAEQSSMEHERMGEGKSGVGDGFLGDIRSSGKGAKPRGKATTGGHWHRALSTW
jgi:hypothetical protein